LINADGVSMPAINLFIQRSSAE